MKKTAAQCMKRECAENRNQLSYAKYENEAINEDVRSMDAKVARAKELLRNAQNEIVSTRANNEALKTSLAELENVYSNLQFSLEMKEQNTRDYIEQEAELEVEVENIMAKHERVRREMQEMIEVSKTTVIFRNEKRSDGVGREEALEVAQLSLHD